MWSSYPSAARHARQEQDADWAFMAQPVRTPQYAFSDDGQAHNESGELSDYQQGLLEDERRFYETFPDARRHALSVASGEQSFQPELEHQPVLADLSADNYPGFGGTLGQIWPAKHASQSSSFHHTPSTLDSPSYEQYYSAASADSLSTDAQSSWTDPTPESSAYYTPRNVSPSSTSSLAHEMHFIYGNSSMSPVTYSPHSHHDEGSHIHCNSSPLSVSIPQPAREHEHSHASFYHGGQGGEPIMDFLPSPESPLYRATSTLPDDESPVSPMSPRTPGHSMSLPMRHLHLQEDTYPARQRGRPASRSLDNADGKSRSGHKMLQIPSSDKASPSSPTKQDKKPALACFFCRQRKIACGPANPESPDRTCNQCLRRNLKCEYPSESRRGMRKKKPSPVTEEDLQRTAAA